MKKRSILLLPVLFLATIITAAELPDSIKIVLEKAGNDTARLNLLQEWCLKAMTDNPAQTQNAIRAFVEEAGKTKNEQRVPSFYQTIGSVYEKKGDYLQAINCYSEAANMAFRTGNKPMQSLMLNKVGNIYIFIGDFPKALENYLKSLSIKEEINDTEGIATSLSNIGNIYFRLDSFPVAKGYYVRSLQLEEKNKNERGIASCYINLGAIYERQFGYDTALQYYTRSIAINTRLNNQYDIASSYINIGNIYDGKNLPDSAMNHFLRALKIYEDLNSLPGMAETYLSIGTHFNKYTLEYKKAVNYLIKAQDIARELRSYEILRRSSKLLSDAYAQLHDFKNAYDNYVLYKKAEDRINNEESVKKFTQLEMQQTFDKKQREQEFQRQQEKRRQMFRTAFILIALVFVTILAVVMYRSYKIKQKDNILLAQQKEEIAAQRDLVTQQRDQIQKQKEEITDSIHYASRIQNAILPPENFRQQIMHEHFILYKPRDIVSGDFYWITHRNGKVVVTGADCTGHGVPGAFMSMLGVSFLNEIVNKEEVLHADQILNRLREQVIRSLHQTGKEGENKDGMDISLMVLDEHSLEMEFAGAYNPCYIIRQEEVMELKADRMPIGIYSEKGEQAFSSQKFQLQKGDAIYLASDGYEDQFGGPEGKKLKAKTFKDTLIKIHDKPMTEQRDYLDNFIEQWRKGYDQVDDILVIGMRI